jgi:hypothetical protein
MITTDISLELWEKGVDSGMPEYILRKTIAEPLPAAAFFTPILTTGWLDPDWFYLDSADPDYKPHLEHTLGGWKLNLIGYQWFEKSDIDRLKDCLVAEGYAVVP